ncbi:ABC transporter permease [Maribellus sp. CM-23]|uniref:ABC transporter permease n=1 Tax=Maribellus sp. CM-23 TaxID=2781026 RepID=UPI001F1E418C|nr:ABC transporter permease [Maribellus sp. CM-23]MCE4562932.1 ABC transporter permease [Maribellus sp. CM-23]
MMNAFKTIYRKALKYKSYTIINVGGLAIAFALSSLLLLYVYNEFQVDAFHHNRDRIYRVVDAGDGTAFTNPLLAAELKSAFPEIEEATRVRHNGNGFYKYENAVVDIPYDMCFDPSVFQMFDFKLIEGEENEALLNPFSIVLTKSISAKIFGDKDPLGKVIRYNNLCDFTVTGVMEDLPSNSTFTVDAILPFDVQAYLWNGDPNDRSDALTNRDNSSFHTYAMFNPNVDVSSIKDKITTFCSEKSYEQAFKLQAMNDIYFGDNNRDRWIHKGEKSIVVLLMSIAVGLLMISIINYINLNSAVTLNNLLGFGVRKILGAKPRQVIIISVVETLLFFAVSIGLATLIVGIINQPFQTILEEEYHFSSLLSPANLMVAFGLLFGIALISGMVPVHYFKKVPASSIIKMKSFGKGSSGLLNKPLIIIQFFIAILFIVSAITIKKQVNFINHKNLGFDKELLVYIDLRAYNMTTSEAEVIKGKLLADSRIQNVAYSSGIFGDVRRGIADELNGKKVLYRRIPTDPDYAKTMKYKIVEGRDFSHDLKTDETSKAYIINQALARAFEMENPLEEKLNNHPIVGVVEDFNFEPIQNSIQPVALLCDPSEALWIANVRLNSSDLQSSIQYVERVFKTLKPDSPFRYSFADDRIATYYRKEVQFSRLSAIFSIVNILISCIGLVGLVLFAINRRIKEIGIRKVNGAKVSEILTMLNSDFIKWVAVAFVLATPVAWYAMSKWLESFAYKTTLSWWIFALAGLLALGIAMLTVSWQSWRAATRNPVEALRYE